MTTRVHGILQRLLSSFSPFVEHPEAVLQLQAMLRLKCCTSFAFSHRQLVSAFDIAALRASSMT